MKKIKITLLLLLFSQLFLAQERKVHGIVKDSLGLIIPGANVLIKANKTYRGAQTDFDGKYEIIAKANDTLIFNFVGMKEKKVTASGTEINVTLEYNPIELENNGIPYWPIKKKPASIAATITTKELINTTNPKQYFKRNAKNNTFIIFVSSFSDLEKKDLEFQKKYNINYLPFDIDYSTYFKRYNTFTFKFLNKKFKKIWQTEIRNDALGIGDFLD